MNSDRKLFKWLGLLILAPILLAVFGGDRFRYPCQDPANWDSAECQKPRCEVTRTCPEHIFKGGEGDPTQSATPVVTKPIEQGCKK
jgi:hypothetical protein